MPGGERPRPFAGITAGRHPWRQELEITLSLLQKDYQRTHGAGGRVSCALFGEIIRQHRAWKRGMPPSRDWIGRGAQNPLLIRAFDLLDEVDGSRAVPSE